MDISENGIAFLKARETYQDIPKDDNGHLMWGYGHDQLPGEPVPTFISEPDADKLLRLKDLPRYSAAVGKLAPWTNQNQFDALCSFAYNLGIAALATMLHHGQDQVPTELPAWRFEHRNGVLHDSKGLANRRALELKLYLGED